VRLDQPPEDLNAQGNGGMRQMHNYVDLNTAFNGKISEPPTDNNNNNNNNGVVKKVGEDASNQAMEDRMRKMKEDRDADIRSITGNKPPPPF
jgi:hypothetical protein